MAKIALSVADVAALMGQRFDRVDEVELLTGGAWSSAFRFLAAGRPMVVKFGRHRDDYERDALAGSWNLRTAPTPKVVELGDAFGGCYAVMSRVAGDPFDALPPSRFVRALDSLLVAYEALADVALPGSGFGIWLGPSGDAPHASWASYLTSVPDRGDDRLRGWQDRLHAHSEAQAVFDDAQREIERIAANCPNERAVNHGDPLWGNILIDERDEVSALLDWGVSVAGDPLYDLAMLLFCVPWKPEIDGDRVRAEATRRAGTVDVGERLRASMLHIGLAALQYQAFAGLPSDIAKTSVWMRMIMASPEPRRGAR